MRLKVSSAKRRPFCLGLNAVIETISPEGTFCDTVQVPYGAGDMQLIRYEIRHGHLSHHPVLF